MTMRNVGIATIGLSVLAVVLLATSTGFFSWLGRGWDVSDVSFDMSDDGRMVYFVDWHGKAKVFNLDSKTIADIDVGVGPVMSIRLDPQGDRVAFSTLPSRVDEHPEIIVARSNSTGVWSIEDRFSGMSPCFAKDGKCLYFSRSLTMAAVSSLGSGVWTDTSVWQYDFSQKIEKKLGDRDFYTIDDIEHDVTRSRLVFSAIPLNGAVQTDLFDLNLETNNIKQLTNCPKDCTCGSGPAISKDGARLAYVSDRARPFDYKVILDDLQTAERSTFGSNKLQQYMQRPVLVQNACYVLEAESFTINSRPRFRLIAFDRQGNWREIIGQDLLCP